MNINKHHIMLMSEKLKHKDWEIDEHEFCFYCSNMYQDMQIIIPKDLDEYNTIDIWCSGQLLSECGNISQIDLHI